MVFPQEKSDSNEGFNNLQLAADETRTTSDNLSSYGDEGPERMAVRDALSNAWGINQLDLKCTITYNVEWELPQYLKLFHIGKTLGKLLTITGNAIDAQANTVEKYLEQSFGDIGISLLNGLQFWLDGSQRVLNHHMFSMTIKDSPQPSSGLRNVNEIKITATYDIQEQLAISICWLSAAVRHSEGIQVSCSQTSVSCERQNSLTFKPEALKPQPPLSCWHPIFTRTVVAPDMAPHTSKIMRSSDARGLEILFDDLVVSVKPFRFKKVEDRLVLHCSTYLIYPVRMLHNKAIQIHLRNTQPLDELENKVMPLMLDNQDPVTFLRSCRLFLGNDQSQKSRIPMAKARIMLGSFPDMRLKDHQGKEMLSGEVRDREIRGKVHLLPVDPDSTYTYEDNISRRITGVDMALRVKVSGALAGKRSFKIFGASWNAGLSFPPVSTTAVLSFSEQPNQNEINAIVGPDAQDFLTSLKAAAFFKSPVIIWDNDAKKGWLVPRVRAYLFFAQVYILQDPAWKEDDGTITPDKLARLKVKARECSIPADADGVQAAYKKILSLMSTPDPDHGFDPLMFSKMVQMNPVTELDGSEGQVRWARLFHLLIANFNYVQSGSIPVYSRYIRAAPGAIFGVELLEYVYGTGKLFVKRANIKRAWAHLAMENHIPVLFCKDIGEVVLAEAMDGSNVSTLVEPGSFSLGTTGHVVCGVLAMSTENGHGRFGDHLKSYKPIVHKTYVDQQIASNRSLTRNNRVSEKRDVIKNLSLYGEWAFVFENKQPRSSLLRSLDPLNMIAYVQGMAESILEERALRRRLKPEDWIQAPKNILGFDLDADSPTLEASLDQHHLFNPSVNDPASQAKTIPRKPTNPSNISGPLLYSTTNIRNAPTRVFSVLDPPVRQRQSKPPIHNYQDYVNTNSHFGTQNIPSTTYRNLNNRDGQNFDGKELFGKPKRGILGFLKRSTMDKGKGEENRDGTRIRNILRRRREGGNEDKRGQVS